MRPLQSGAALHVERQDVAELAEVSTGDLDSWFPRSQNRDLGHPSRECYDEQTISNCS